MPNDEQPIHLSYSTPVRLRGRRRFTLFAVFNAFSYLLLSGNILTLFLLRLDASRTIVGLVSSFLYISFFFMLIGKRFGMRLGAVRIFASSWLLRYVSILPITAVPWLVAADHREAALGLFVASALGFNIFRGIGLVGQSPILGELSAGPDRGAFLLRFQIIANSVAVLAGVLIALLLGEDAPLARYATFIASGVAFGFIASAIVAGVPEPPGVREGAAEPLIVAVRRALGDYRFKRFLIAFGALALVSGMARPFLIVYVREVFLQSDSAAIAYGVVGNIGAIAMGFFIKLLLDRVGAKPLILALLCVAVVGFGLAAWAPQADTVLVVAVISTIFFIVAFGSAGAESCSQSYFYALLKPSDQMNMGIVYFLVLGLGGSIGSFGGGVFLDALAFALPGAAATTIYRVYYSTIVVASIGLLVPFARLERLGARSFRGTIGVFFSLRDLRAMTLLDRLEKTSDIDSEQSVIRNLGSSGSTFAREELLNRLESPSFVIRSEALRALEQIRLDPALETALVDEIQQHPYTTAHMAARILGSGGSRSILPVLREAIYSDDYLLSGEAMTSLGRLGDASAADRIQMVLRVSENPYLIIHAAEALRLLRHVDSIPLLFGALAGDSVPLYIRDEVILSVAGIVGVRRWFYPHYRRFLRDPTDAVEFLKETALQDHDTDRLEFLTLCLTDPAEFAAKACEILTSPPPSKTIDELGSTSPSSQMPDSRARNMLAPLIREQRLYRFERVRFFYAAVASYRRGRS